MDTDASPPSEGDRDSVDPAAGTQDITADTMSQHEKLQKLACDQCRGRKVGCDRHSPCSRCVHMGIRCEYTMQPRPRPKRPRKLPGNSHEAKFDELFRKLDTVQRLLENGCQPNPLAAEFASSHMSQTTTPAPLTALAPDVLTQTSSPLTALEGSEPEYEGHSALSAHTTFANNLLKAIAGRDATSLQKEVPSNVDLRNTHSQVSGVINLPMPSADKAFHMLRLMKEDPRMQLPWIMELESIDQFQEYIFAVYSSSYPTAAQQIILLAGWVSMMPACTLGAADAAQKADLEAQVAIYRDSLDLALARLPFHLPATFDNTLALTMASTCYVSRSWIKLAWNVNCAAAHMAQALGLHKACLQDPETNATTRRKARLFVMIFTSDKSLSLRLGRASTIRDEEIPLDLKMLLRGVNTAPSKIPYPWLAFSRAQGLVYDQLYSPRAMQQTQEVKQRVAIALLEEVGTLNSERTEANDEFETKARAAFGDGLARLYEGANRVSQLALVCLIYHGVAPWTHRLPFYEECIPLAREALTEHCHCFALLSEHGTVHVEIYLRWALFTSPFIPFIILLRHVVETHNLADLQLLGKIIKSIEAMHDSFPNFSRQLGLFKPLYEVTRNFIEAETEAMPAINNFATFLQESSIDSSFRPVLMSTLMPQSSVHETLPGEQLYPGNSLLDVWGEIDHVQYDTSGFNVSESGN